MDNMQKATKNEAAESQLPEGLDPQALFDHNVEAVNKLMAEQLAAADTSKPTTLSEILADEKGVFAAKAQELGLAAEWNAFQAAQKEIVQLREEHMKIDEQRGVGADRVANITPLLQQEDASSRKAGGIGALIGAVIGGGASAFSANKMNKAGKTQAIAGVVGALLGAIGGGTIGSKTRENKTVDTMKEQVANLGEVQLNPELESKAAEVRTRIGMIEKQTLEPLINGMAMRMTENDVNAHIQAAKEQAAAEAKKAEEEAAAKQAAAGEKAPEQHNADEKQASPEHPAQPMHAPQGAEAQAHPQQQMPASHNPAPAPANAGHAPAIPAQQGASEAPLRTVISQRGVTPPAASHAQAVTQQRAEADRVQGVVR